MMFVIIMRGEEEKEVFKNLEGRLLSTKSLFENPDMSIQLFKFFHGRLVKVVTLVLVNLGPLRPQKDSIFSQVVKSFSTSACKGRYWQATTKNRILWSFFPLDTRVSAKKV